MGKKIKVKIGNLPNGYKFKNGKIVKVMATGGAPYSNSLGPIPRTFANLEAEKGETALTDLTNDGNFELYNIGGKRHPQGGTALSLPPQSFIFSDTAKMKLNKDQLTRFNINSKKKMTPAAVSKKFPLNKYYSILNGEFVDDIATRSAELMLEKNKMKLSELAFVSESKKKFEDGVPLAAYPFLMSKKIDPMQFVQKVNKLNEEQAMIQMIDQLPPEEQKQILSLQNFTGGQGGPPPQGPPMAARMPPMPQAPPQGGGMPPQGMIPPQQMMAMYGGSLPKAQYTNELADNTISVNIGNQTAPDVTATDRRFITDEDVFYHDAMGLDDANVQKYIGTNVGFNPTAFSKIGNAGQNRSFLSRNNNIANLDFMLGSNVSNDLMRAYAEGRLGAGWGVGNNPQLIPNTNVSVNNPAHYLNPYLSGVAGLDFNVGDNQSIGVEGSLNSGLSPYGRGLGTKLNVNTGRLGLNFGVEDLLGDRKPTFGATYNFKQGGSLLKAQTQIPLPRRNRGEVADMLNIYQKEIEDTKQALNEANQISVINRDSMYQPPIDNRLFGVNYNSSTGEFNPPPPMIYRQTGAPSLYGPGFKLGGGLHKAQFESPESMQVNSKLPSDRLQEVSDMVPFNQQDFTSKYPKISYGNDINKGINQGSLVTLAEQLVKKSQGRPDPMYDGRYKEDPQADYAQKGGMVAAGLYNAASPNSHNMIPAGLYNNKLNQFLYGGEDFENRYVDYEELQTFDDGGEKIYGMDRYNQMLDLYNSEDWDKVNKFGYESYLKARDKYPNLQAIPEMTQEEYEEMFMLDQKFKYLMHEAGALDGITITLPNGQTVTGNDIKTHEAWDNPRSGGGFSDGDPNGMYRLVYDQIMQKYPDAGFEALPTDKDELMNMVLNKQATFSSLGGLKKHAEKMSADGDDSWSNLLSNVNLEAFGSDKGGSGLMGEDRWSDLDGKYGDTFNSQIMQLSNTPGEKKERNVETCYLDANGQVKPDQAKAKVDCETKGGRYDTDVCQCIEKGEFKMPDPIPNEYWKQDIIKLDALSDVDLNKYYPSRQSFTGNFMDPAYKDPTREIAAIAEQAQIAGDMAMQMTSGQGLAAVLSKIQGTAGQQIAGALDKVQNDNVDIYNQAQQFNAGVASNVDVLNQDALKKYMDEVNTVDQNYDNAKNQLRIQIADARANAETNRSNTYNLNTMTPNYNVRPGFGGDIQITNPKDFFANNVVDPQSQMDKRIALENQYIEQRCGNISSEKEKIACMNNARLVVNDMFKSQNQPKGNRTIPGYQGNNISVDNRNNNNNNDWFDNNPDDMVGGCGGTQYGCCPDGVTAKADEMGTNCGTESKYGSELRAALAERRNGGWW